MFGLPKEAIGAIVAAIVAGFVALISLIISKEQKVSEFRQQWIDALREDIASVIRRGHGLSLEIYSRNNRGVGNDSGLREDTGVMTEAAARIRLRLNLKERESTELYTQLNYFVRTVKTSADTDVIGLATDKLVEASKVVLKQEWMRVQAGEFTYRWTRRIISVILAVLVYILLFGSYVHTFIPSVK
jgi:hypothetical protein